MSDVSARICSCRVLRSCKERHADRTARFSGRLTGLSALLKRSRPKVRITEKSLKTAGQVGPNEGFDLEPEPRAKPLAANKNLAKGTDVKNREVGEHSFRCDVLEVEFV
ncbi:hypothetical protein SKAU_G00049080 [Synaphobranchus kaupii]|uniref:Uncharacterized protein n=1 Tax=Synaphobranchus kaupii TaxID=118154 RepID=A0A9Q1J990_SYNKA|nr:hypothetical protein SKAU_G00049080 [Synaphobranchus kaupii]